MVIYWPFWILASYLVGALPTSYLTGRLLRNIDLRRYGSGNLGATNTFRVLGPGPGILVLGVDLVKGFTPVYFIPALAGLGSGGSRTAVVFQILIGATAVAGHIFNPFFKFRGGKGVATATGVFLAICPAAVGLSFGVWLVIMALFRIVSLASLGAAFSFPLFVYLTVSHQVAGYGIIQIFSIFFALVLVVTHRSNIGRLLRGEEKRLTRDGRTSL